MIVAKSITRTFVSGNIENTVLKGVDVTVKDGEFLAIMGRSGAGKSTLMYQLSLLDKPTSGSIEIAGTDVTTFSDRQRTLFRLENLGYIFQDYALLPELTAVENVSVPLLMQGASKRQAYELAAEALAQVQLEERLTNLPSQLSGGEQQRVSIARAIAHNPTIIFADEPTANLDSETAKTVMNLLVNLHNQGQTIVMVTHEREYGMMAERIVDMNDGLIVKETKGKNRKKAK